jgi:ATP-dependent Clp protease ATP-binding subunit ClpA
MSISMRSHLTERAREVFALAHDLADRRGDAALAPAHLALGLLQEGQNIPVYILHARGVPLEALARELETELPAPGTPREPASTRQWTADDEPFVEPASR